MVVARYTHGQLVILDRLREMVRLGAGLEPDGRLNKEVARQAQGVIGGQPAAGAGRGTTVLVRQGDRWLMIAEHLGPKPRAL